MGYADRQLLYKKLGKARDSKIISYITGDRRNLETQIAAEVVDYLVNHLDKIGETKKISLFLYTRGGETLAAWSIANLLYQYCDEYEVIIPSKALSSGTLICLGASTIIMTKQAMLGPIDPSLNTPLNPQIPGAPPNSRSPVSVEAINGFIDLAKNIGIKNGADLTKLFEQMANHVHPLVLGQVYRTRNQIRMIGRRLLKHTISDKKKISKILDFLCSESGSHDYTIYRREAENELGLNIITPTLIESKLIKDLYKDISAELKLSEPYSPDLELGLLDTMNYEYHRALIESVGYGSHTYTSRGILCKKQIPNPNGPMQRIFEDNRTFEGWEHGS